MVQEYLKAQLKTYWIWELVDYWIKYNKNQAETQKNKINYCVLSVLECVIKFSSHFSYLSSYISCRVFTWTENYQLPLSVDIFIVLM